MFINKTGSEHKDYGINNQDYGFILNNLKCVVDGCSEGLHSEVGAKLFCELFQQGYGIDIIFIKILSLLGNSAESIKNYLCFTILYIIENDDYYIVNYCGDGYIIKQKHDNTVEFEKIDDGEYPKYYVYNYSNKKNLNHYSDGVQFNQLYISKKEYKDIGVASDGLRFIFGKEYESEFINYLVLSKESAIKRLINRESKHFKDDITIAF
jgi:hypothetical protein